MYVSNNQIRFALLCNTCNGVYWDIMCSCTYRSWRPALQQLHRISLENHKQHVKPYSHCYIVSRMLMKTKQNANEIRSRPTKYELSSVKCMKPFKPARQTTTERKQLYKVRWQQAAGRIKWCPDFLSEERTGLDCRRCRAMKLLGGEATARTAVVVVSQWMKTWSSQDGYRLSDTRAGVWRWR